MLDENKSVQEKTRSHVFKMRLGERLVTIKFSDTESVGVKDNVRDILTGSYEERVLNVLRQTKSGRQQ